MILLDLYCCQGGSGEGYSRAGIRVVGVDNKPQPRYPFAFGCADALSVLRDLLRGVPIVFGSAGAINLSVIQGIHASPPCQFDSDTQRLWNRDHPDLIAPTRELLEATGLPYVIENVEGSRDKLRDPVTLCGTMFGKPYYRHRLFETNFPLVAPPHPEHRWPQAKMGRPAKPGEFIQAVGNFSGVQRVREEFEMPWASRDGLRECVPPVYTECIGRQLMRHLTAREAA